MTIIKVRRGEAVGIPFSITDAGGGLLGQRVSWCVGGLAEPAAVYLRKVGGLPGSTAAITITLQNPQQINGTINMLPADFAALPDAKYRSTLWVDDGAGTDRCVTAGGADDLQILPAIPRAG